MTNLSNRKDIFLLLIILAIALALRLAVFGYVYSTNPSGILKNDSPGYDNSAKALLCTGRFTVSPDRPQTPQTLRTPGYPVFIAGVYSIFGEHHPPVAVIQILFSMGTVIITYLIARILWRPRAALIAVLLLILEFASFIDSFMLVTETLFTFALIAAVISGVKLILNKGDLAKYALLLGVSLALATLIRPISYYLVVPILAGFFIFKIIYHQRWREIIMVLILIGLPWVVLVGGWQLRNYLVTGSLEFSRARGIDLLFFRAAGVLAEEEGVTLKEAQQKIRASLPDTEGWSQKRLNDLYIREGWSLIRRYPFSFIKLTAQRIMIILTAQGSGYFIEYGDSGPIGDLLKLPMDKYIRKWFVGKTFPFVVYLFEIFHLLILNTAAIYSLLRIVSAEKEKIFVHIFIWGVILYLLIVSAEPDTGARFRVPITPLLAVYAGAGLNRLFESLGLCREK